MMHHDALRRGLATASILLSLFGCGSSSEEESSDSSGDPNDPGSGSTQVTAVQLGINLLSLSTRAATLGDGVVIAGFTGTGLMIARLDSSLEVLWARELASGTEALELEVDSQERILVLTGQSTSPAKLLRLTSDGELETAVESSERQSDFELLADDGVLLADGTRLSADLEVVSRLSAGGESVAETRDGFVFLSALDLGLGGRQSGITLRFTDESGALLFQTFASPTAANYTAIGVRELPSGEILAAVSGDTTAGHALFTAIFDKDGAFVSGEDPQLSIQSEDGISVPLQFGSGIDMLGDGADTYVSLVANSGVFGTDARQQLAVRLNESGQATSAMTLGGGIAKSGSRLFVFNAGGQVTMTNSLSNDCVPSPDVAARTATVDTEFKTSAELFPTESNASFTPVELELTELVLSPTQACGT